MTDPNEPIAPFIDLNNRECQGLTKREYFAAQIMAGFAALPFDELPTSTSSKTMAVRADDAMLATIAVQWADCLIEALNNAPKP